jgi:hypothetical protein
MSNVGQRIAARMTDENLRADLGFQNIDMPIDVARCSPNVSAAALTVPSFAT